MSVLAENSSTEAVTADSGILSVNVIPVSGIMTYEFSSDRQKL
ncbi:hypothetical protein [Nostoc sp. 2RC]|nr:hypothetical protein [Nostoc sp. 2RC]